MAENYTPGDTVRVKHQGRSLTGTILSIEETPLGCRPHSKEWLARKVTLSVKYSEMVAGPSFPGTTKIIIAYQVLLGDASSKGKQKKGKI